MKTEVHSLGTKKKQKKCESHILLRLYCRITNSMRLHRYLITLYTYRCNLISFFIVFNFLYFFESMQK
jgi:hypothetical protein